MNISVIIPTLNEAETISQTLREVRERSSGYVDEIIVVDGGSTDNTTDLAEEAGAQVMATTQKGRARQMNRGAQTARSGIFYFLHADSIPPPNFDQQILEAHSQGYSAGCFRLAFDNDHPLLRFYAWCTRFDWNAFRFGDQSLFVTKQLFEEVGGYNSELIVMEDNMMVRGISQRAEFIIIPDNVVTSARKYEQVGMIRLQLVFILIYILFFLGFSQEQLVSTYKALVNY